MNNLASRLKNCREELGLTQGELAKRAGVKNQSIIGSLESGYRKRSSYIPAIASVLGVDPLWLATGKGDKRGTLSKAEELLRLMGIYNVDSVNLEQIELAREALKVPEDRRKDAKKIINVFNEPDDKPDGKKEEKK
ncbi:helix-turn-helix domain-containing protein [Nitrosomonas marina]|uniref:Helix-turn-helix n=1 Tax=Nitrosomonas marina TaxID=917 RepID=A0A1H8IUD2_9PROT|nr:helix-turn-helix domain-containing protein [Nitrosomonas marina]SEN71597.1 Helix-turn-helix [Nitrosomonas marina]